MKKKLLSLLCATVLTAVCCVSAMAAPSRLVDDADLLTSSEESDTLALLDGISSEYGVDVVIVTENSLGGATPRAYADDTLDYAGYSRNAVLLLISMEERDVYISTAGSCISAFSDRTLDGILDQVINYLAEGEYAGAFRVYAEQCDICLSRYEDGYRSPVYAETSVGFDYMRAGLIALCIGFVVALTVTLIMKSKLKSVRKQTGARDYVIPGSMNVTHSRDMFLYRNVTRRARPQPKSGGGGGSSVHHSSGGFSHGGRGGKF